MNQQRYQELKAIALETLKPIAPYESPVDVKALTLKLGYNLYPLYELSKSKRELYEAQADKYAFLLIENGIRNIYYDTASPYANLSICHEIAHDILEHQGDGITEETEAGALATLLLYPPDAPEKQQQPKKANWKSLVALSLSVFLLLSCIFVVSAPKIPPLPAAPQETQVVTIDNDKGVLANAPIEDLVYITKSGDKYHRSDCQYVRDKENLIELNKLDAQRAGYEPCKICRP